MNTRRDTASPFGVRVFYDAAEFEQMMDEARHRVGDDVFTEGQGIDVDRVLLKAYRVEPDFVDLPQGVLGRTQFKPDGQVRVEVDKQLADAAESDQLSRRRLRSTLAHEGGHIACHLPIFLEDLSTPSLFGRDEEAASPNILCRDLGVGAQQRYDGKWWEFQANQCMALLLLPAALVRSYLKAILADKKLDSFDEALRADRDVEVIRELGRVFDTSDQMTLFRLTALGFVPEAGQPTLL